MSSVTADVVMLVFSLNMLRSDHVTGPTVFMPPEATEICELTVSDVLQETQGHSKILYLGISNA